MLGLDAILDLWFSLRLGVVARGFLVGNVGCYLGFFVSGCGGVVVTVCRFWVWWVF